MPFYQHQAIDFDEWPRKRNPNFEYARFESKYSATEKILEREVNALTPRMGSVFLKTFHSPRDVRKDGQLRQGEVRSPEYPGVILEFDSLDKVQRKYVKIQFVCDRFKSWKDNVRAIALGMEALRKVERYGITSAQEQYEGFKAKTLPPKIELGASMSVADALAFIQHKSQKPVIANQGNYEEVYKYAIQKCHPDKGGSHDDMAKLNIARDTLRAYFNGARA
jgi:hypothetical protein